MSKGFKTSKVYQVSDEQFREIVANSYSYSDCLRALGLGTSGGSSTDVLKRRIQELECSTEHFNGTKSSGLQRSYSLKEILVENSTYSNTTNLKERLLKEGLLQYHCAICGISEWQGKTLSLQLDHINGNHTDNRIENLRLLCPNCHSQTHTYAGKNAIKYIKSIQYCSECGKELKYSTSGLCAECSAKQNRVVERPDRNTFKQLIRTIPFTTLGLQFGVSDKAISKWCISYNLPNKKSDIKKYTDEEWANL